MKRRRLGFGGSMCARQPLWNPCRPALFDRRMGKAGYGGRPFDTDRPLPVAAVPALETLREHNPQLSQGNAGPPRVSLPQKGGRLGGARPWGRPERVRRCQLPAASLFKTRRFSDRKPA